MQQPKGLNGTTVFYVNDAPVGRVDGDYIGMKRPHLLTVSIRMERLDQQPSYTTISHGQATNPVDFAITFDVWNQSRTNPDIIQGGPGIHGAKALGHLVDVDDAFKGRIRDLRVISRWHLNAMTQNCEHQAHDAGLNSTPCPITGYRWGSEWLVTPLPGGDETFLANIRDLFSAVDDEYVWRG